MTQIALYLLFALITVPIAKRLKLGSVLGYLIAGVLLGPLFGLIGSEALTIQHIAEFGVVMMMFLIGLELRPKSIWQMRYQLLGLGTMQVLISALILTVLMVFLLQFTWQSALAVGMVLALSSTAIVLQSLQEIKQMDTKAGQSILSVLIAQDIAVIPIFSILPILVVGDQVMNTQHQSWLSHFPAGIQALIIFVIICLMVLIGKYIMRYVFRYIAQTRLAEIFTALVLLLIIGVALMMESIGLSAALGAFIAGVILSGSEYRHEIESQISSFKGLLMGVFFISIGTSIHFSVLQAHWQHIILYVIVLMLIKMVVLMLLARVFRLKGADFWLFSLSLTQGGEFAFVLLSFAVSLSVLTMGVSEIITLVVILSMIITSILFLMYEKVILPHYQGRNNAPEDSIAHQGKVIIAGAGRFGQIVARVLRANKYESVILDYDSNMINTFRRYGNRAYYGNALNPEMLLAAGIESAEVFVAATNDQEAQTALVRLIRRHSSRIQIIARATNRHHVYELEEAGANYVIRETFESAAKAAEEVLIKLGDSKESAFEKVSIFKEYDQKTLEKLKTLWLKSGESKVYINQLTANSDTLSQLMQTEKSEDQNPKE